MRSTAAFSLRKKIEGIRTIVGPQWNYAGFGDRDHQGITLRSGSCRGQDIQNGQPENDAAHKLFLQEGGKLRAHVSIDFMNYYFVRGYKTLKMTPAIRQSLPSRKMSDIVKFHLARGGEVKQIIKAVIARTPYRVIRDRGANRFQAIDVSLRSMKDRGFCPRIVLDGGAHLGSFSLVAKKIFPRATFHLIEPQPACRVHLKALCSTEGFVLHECALADHVGELRFSHASKPSTGAHIKPDSDAETDTVSASTLDALFESRVASDDRALLKMDLQGYELHALRGGPKVLRSIEVILTEVSFFAQAYEPSIVNLITFLDASGFQLYDIASLSGRTRDNRLNQGDFVFARKGSQLLEDGRWE